MHRAPSRAFRATLRAIVRPQPAGGEYGDYVAGKGRDRNRGGPRHRQRHRGGVREGRRKGACGKSKRRRGPGHDEGDCRGRRRSVVSPGQRQESRRHGANGGNLHRALRRYRHPLRQRRRLPYVPYRRHDRRGLGRRARHQPEGRLLQRPGVHPADEGAGAGPHRCHLVDHRTQCGLAGAFPLHGVQGGCERVRHRRGAGARQAPHHGERRSPPAPS